jgi:outer membrane receptor protein involved in Fe transport
MTHKYAKTSRINFDQEPQFKLKALAIALLIASCNSQAQVSSASASPTKVDSSEKGVPDLQTVIVSSGKRNQAQRDVAGSISAIQGGALEAAGALDQEDILKMVPGVQVNKGNPNQSLPTIRGVGTVTNSGALSLQQGTTGIYIQDIPFTDPSAFIATADLSPFDLERVEVLRGPQGALYGSASLGGAIRYLVNKPNLNTKEFSVQGSLGNVSNGGSDRSLYMMANLPVEKDVSGLRIVAFDRKDSGYIRNIGTGQDRANELRQHGGRIMGGLNLGQGAKVNAMLMTQSTSVDDGMAVSSNPNRLEINTPNASPRSSSFSLGNIQAEVPMGAHTFFSNTGFVDKKTSSNADETRRGGDLGPLLGLPSLTSIVSPSTVNGKAFSQEFRLASADNSQFSYVGGLFYQHATLDGVAVWNAPGGAALWGSAVLPNNLLLKEISTVETSEIAIFGDGEYKLTNDWSVGVGGRAYKNKSHYTVDSRLIEAVLGAAIIEHANEESGFTPKASIKYRFGEQMWYALASKGYRLGGVNAGSGTIYKSDSLWNYETGLRLTQSRDLKVDLTAFLLDWTNAQVNARQPGTPPIYGIANVGEAKIKGLEIASQWRATNKLLLSATLAYTDAVTASPFTSKNGNVVAEGTRMPGTAKIQSFLQGTYLFAGPENTSGKLTLVHAFTGDRTLSIDSGGVAAAYGQLDARVSFAKDNWQLGFYLNNLTDKRGINGGSPVATFGGSSYTDYYLIKPRTAGVTLRYDL